MLAISISKILFLCIILCLGLLITLFRSVEVPPFSGRDNRRESYSDDPARNFLPVSLDLFFFLSLPTFVRPFVLSLHSLQLHCVLASCISSAWSQLRFALLESSSKWVFTSCIKQNTWIHIFIAGKSDFPHIYIFLCLNEAFSIVNEKNNHIDLTLTQIRCSSANRTLSNHTHTCNTNNSSKNSLHGIK